jgi:hypothetical protein
VTIEVADPEGVAARWAEVLGVPPSVDGERPELRLDGGRVVFAPARTEPEPGLTEIEVALSGPRPDWQPQHIGGVRFVCPGPPG